MPSLSEILNSKIGKAGKSKAYVAHALGVGEKTIENYMHGKRNPKPDAMVKLSKILNFELSQLSEQTVPTTATETPQNGHGKEPKQTLTRIGELIKEIQYYVNPKPTIEEIADKIKFSRPHLTILTKNGHSNKAYTRLQNTFGELVKKKKEEMTTTTDTKVYQMKSNGHPNEKDLTIRDQARAAIINAEAANKNASTIEKLVDLLAVKTVEK